MSAAARVAVVGAETHAGAILRQVLADEGIPGNQVNLYAADTTEGLIGEYDGEARLIQPIRVNELGAHDVVLICGGGAELKSPDEGSGRRLKLDLEGKIGGLPLAHPRLRPLAADEGPLAAAVASPLSGLLADLIGSMAEIGVDRAHAAVLEPAEALGEAAMEELREQTTRLFNFAEPPREVLGHQLAFNVLPSTLLDPGGDARIESQIAELTGWPAGLVTVQRFFVPVFHGHALSVDVTLSRRVEVEQLRERIGGYGGVETAAGPEPGTPVEAAPGRITTLTSIEARSDRRLVLQLVAGDVARLPAEQAVGIARALELL